MSDRNVALRYANALFRTAQRNDLIEAVENDLQSISGILKTDTKFSDFLETPRISREEKVLILEKLFADRVTALTMQVLRLLMQRRRENEFEAVREEYVRLRREHGNVLFASVTSSQDLTPDEKKGVIDRLKSQAGKDVEADFSVDPGLIGGMKIQFGDYVLDGTVRGSLRRLRDTLKYQLLKQS